MPFFVHSNKVNIALVFEIVIAHEDYSYFHNLSKKEENVL